MKSNTKKQYKQLNCAFCEAICTLPMDDFTSSIAVSVCSRSSCSLLWEEASVLGYIILSKHAFGRQNGSRHKYTRVKGQKQHKVIKKSYKIPRMQHCIFSDNKWQHMSGLLTLSLAISWGQKLREMLHLEWRKKLKENGQIELRNRTDGKSRF